jgi:hypothetical protein
LKRLKHSLQQMSGNRTPSLAHPLFHKPIHTEPFQIFVLHFRTAVMRQNPGITNPEVLSRLSQMWKGLSAEEKGQYYSLAEAAVVDLRPKHRRSRQVEASAEPQAASTCSPMPIARQELLGTTTTGASQSLLRVHLPLLPFDQEDSCPLK